MSPHKRRKLQNKRTPWIKSRYSRRARAIQTFIRAMVLAQSHSQINAIRFAPARTGIEKLGKACAIAEVWVSASKAVLKVPLYGSKTQ